jgi:Uma2 family endonuclease
VLDSDKKILHVFRDNESPRQLSGQDVVESIVLPGFTCRVEELFEGV